MYNDSEVRTMIEIVLKNRCIGCYVVHGVDTPEVILEIGGNTQSQTKVSTLSEGRDNRPKKLPLSEEEEGA